MDRSPLPGSRFQIVARLGEGAFGVVYEAIDRNRGETIAVKALHRSHPDAVFRFKQEFRSLKDLEHPNLVRLGELIEQHGRWFFTMELVRGTDFLSYVRRRPRSRPAPSNPDARFSSTPPAYDSFEEDRLRPALVQLAQGLVALHRAGKVHRDVKPPNVRVTAEGRVVLLDFGLITETGEEVSSQATSMVGTAAYMSPEQAASMPVGPASDWYSLGVLLYEALTGRRPFGGSPLQVLFDKQRVAPPDPATLVRGIPADLNSLCVALLQIEPGERPDGQEVLARLGSRAPGVTAPGRVGFVGRGAELERLLSGLQRVRAGRADSFYVHGESGIGKTRLLAEVALRIREHEPGAVVLKGRCHESETVPYKAFDNVIDGLSRVLRGLPDAECAELVPRQAVHLLEVFPVLARVDAIGRLTGLRDPAPDPWEQRNEAFGALRELLTRLARKLPLVILIDDLQWADAESTQLLERLVGTSEHPPVLIVGAGAHPADCNRNVRRVIAQSLCREPERMLELVGLSDEDGERLASSLIHAHGLVGRSGMDAVEVAPVASGVGREARGHPLFIDFLVRHGTELGLDQGQVPTLAATLQHRVAQLDGGERTLLELMAVSGAPLHARVLGEAMSRSPAELAEPAARLRAAGLIAEEGAGEAAALSIVQERVRDAVLLGVPVEERPGIHRRLASALLAQGVEDAEALAVHLSAAGDVETAAHYAVLAATSAFDSLAFDRSARLFELALDLLPRDDGQRRRRLYTKLADALAGAGRSGDAADAYLEAASGGLPLEVAEARTRAAQQMMQAGRVSEGLTTIQRLLADVGHTYPTSPASALTSLLLRRVRLRIRGLSFEERSATWIKPAELHEVDLLWSVSCVLAMGDMTRASDFQARHLLRALDTGEPYRVARALAIEAWFQQSMRSEPHSRVTELFATGRMLAERSGNAHAHAMLALGEGVAANSLGRFELSVAKCQEAERLLRERCRGVSWELDSAQYMIDLGLLFMGRFGELCQRIPRQLEEARERGDKFVEVLLRMSVAYWPQLFVGDVEGARSDVLEAADSWTSVGFQAQRFMKLVALTHVDLYGRPDRAYETNRTCLGDLDRTSMRRIPMLRVLADFLSAASCIASAQANPALERQRLREASRHARQLRREKLSFAAPFAASIDGAIAARTGDRARAASLLNEAASGFDGHHMLLYSAAARFGEGKLLGGEHGRDLCRRAQEAVAAQGVGDASRLLAAALPGFSDQP